MWQGHSQPISRRRPTRRARRHSPEGASGKVQASVAGANSPLSLNADGKEWNPYSLGAHKYPTPDKQISPETLPAPAAQPVAVVASRLAAAGPNYTLPPLFRDTFAPDAVAEIVAGRFTAATQMSEGQVEEAWQDAMRHAVKGNDHSTSRHASDRSVRHALGKLFELPRSIVDAALRNQLPATDTREARRRAGYARGSRRPSIDRKPVPQLNRDRFGWLARYLGHYEQLWFLSECLEEHEDVPLTLREFECAVRNPHSPDSPTFRPG